MERVSTSVSSSSATILTFTPNHPLTTTIPTSSPKYLFFPTHVTSNNFKTLSLSTSQLPLIRASRPSAITPIKATLQTTSNLNTHQHWMVLMRSPIPGVSSKPGIINYYVKTLERVLGSEKDAQMCMYDASLDTHFGFCCVIDEEASRQLASLPEVLLVRPDWDYNAEKKDYNPIVGFNSISNQKDGSVWLFPAGSTRHWMVRISKPGVGVVTKAQMVDYYAQLLTKVLGNEKDAQMCIYHVSWQSNFGFCCELDDECAKELAGVPGVLSVQPDKNFGSEIKDYGGNNVETSDMLDSSQASQVTPIKTKKLFVTGLSFYTSEKTLRAAFEGFGELVEVKIIMDKISKRSKGYAFVEYTTEEAASAALKEMNGKIINGWMIVVDVAKSNPPKYSRGRPRPQA